MVAAVRRGFARTCALKFSFQIRLGHEHIDKIPGQQLVQRIFPLGVFLLGESAVRKRLRPCLRLKLLRSRVKPAAELISAKQHLAQAFVPARKRGFQHGEQRIVAVQLRAAYALEGVSQ